MAPWWSMTVSWLTSGDWHRQVDTAIARRKSAPPPRGTSVDRRRSGVSLAFGVGERFGSPRPPSGRPCFGRSIIGNTMYDF